MEYAIRHHISLHMDEDPTRYRRLSERLEQILADHRGNWEQQAIALADFLEKIKTEDSERDRGDSSVLNRVESASTALYGLLAQETATDGVIDQQQDQRLAEFSGRCTNWQPPGPHGRTSGGTRWIRTTYL